MHTLLFHEGKVFLNSIEHLDPTSDEWTTFVTVSEKSLSPRKTFPVNFQPGEEKIQTHSHHIMTNNGNEPSNSNYDVTLKEKEDGIVFEMDLLEPVENEVSCANSSNDGSVLQESTEHDQTLPSESTSMLDPDQTVIQKHDVTPKHVLR